MRLSGFRFFLLYMETSKQINFHKAIIVLEDCGDFSEALRITLEEEEKHPLSVDVLLTKAQLYNQLGQYTKAVKATEAVIKIEIDNEQAYLIKGISLFNQKIRRSNSGIRFKSRAESKFTKSNLRKNISTNCYRKI